MSKTSMIDFAEAFYVYRLFAFAYREFEIRIVAVPRTGRKLSAYVPLVPLLILKLVSLLEQKRKIIKLWTCKQAKCIVKFKIVKFKTHKSLQEKVVRLSIERLTNMQKNTDTKSIQDDDLDFMLDEFIGYEKFHKIIKQLIDECEEEKKDDEQ